MLDKIYKVSSFIIVGFLGVIGVLLVITAFPITGNIKAYVVQSGSMEPAIKTGSLVFIKPHSSYEVGDVITFGAANSVPTTHRIVEIQQKEDGMVYHTKGDANQSADQRPIAASEIRGSVFLRLPYFGYIIHFARQPLGFGVLIVLPAVMLIFDELKKIWTEIGRIRKRKEVKSEIND